MQFVLGLLLFIAVASSILLMVVILLQEPKGGGLAAALGGSGMEAIGVNTGSVNKFTSAVATVWVVACLLHAVLMGTGTAHQGGSNGDAPAAPGGAPGDGDAPAPGDSGK